jgi:succinate dehydrogenase / fumarate reductase cytochrome b subunit
LLDRSLSDPGFFMQLQTWLSQAWFQFILFLICGLLFQHFFSGLRHLAIDIDWGIDRQTARITAWLTFVGTVLLLAVTGAWLQ